MHCSMAVACFAVHDHTEALLDLFVKAYRVLFVEMVARQAE